ncbi:MAG TPA: endonuclease/exonuclease/phosphatase family protein [Acidimicrobiales bacterium]|nr:endonuclease/exonuclease/phosphatase family protein [Acidimicrobiales bacterium]
MAGIHGRPAAAGRGGGHRRRLAAGVAAAVALAFAATACSSGSTSGSSGTSTTAPDPHRLTVMTRNMYFGADLSPLFGATAAQLPALSAAAYKQMQANVPADRMVSLANEIARARPDLVALQEAVEWKVQAPAAAQPAPLYDFVALLLQDLGKAGAHYGVVSTSNGFAGALPVPGVGVVSLQDRDVVLSRANVAGLSLSNPKAGTYTDKLMLTVAGVQIPVVRGWASIDGSLSGRPFAFVGTHLEAYSDPVRDAQEAQLLSMVGSEQVPVILAGDFNSPATGTGSNAYQVARQHGLGDAWLEANPSSPGNTYGYSADLTTGSMYQRIDFVLLKGPFKAERAVVVGVDPAEKTPTGRWPSDHAGLAAQLVVPAS